MTIQETIYKGIKILKENNIEDRIAYSKDATCKYS